jgi:hypothetical protein
LNGSGANWRTGHGLSEVKQLKFLIFTVVFVFVDEFYVFIRRRYRLDSLPSTVFYKIARGPFGIFSYFEYAFSGRVLNFGRH